MYHKGDEVTVLRKGKYDHCTVVHVNTLGEDTSIVHSRDGRDYTVCLNSENPSTYQNQIQIHPYTSPCSHSQRRIGLNSVATTPSPSHSLIIQYPSRTPHCLVVCVRR